MRNTALKSVLLFVGIVLIVAAVAVQVVTAQPFPPPTDTSLTLPIDAPKDVGGLAGWIVMLVLNSAPMLLISGWVSRYTKATGVWMLVQTWVLAIAATFLLALVGVIQIPLGDIWTWVKLGFGNGLWANIFYKVGIFNSLLDGMGARPPAQLMARANGTMR